MIKVRQGEKVDAPVLVKGPDTGKHGALIWTEARLYRDEGTSLDKTPADAILREDGRAVSPAVEGAVQSGPTFSGGGGTGGADIYTVPLGTGEGASFSAGDYVRSKTAGKGGIYQIDTIATDTLSVFAGENEMDIANGDTVEKVTPEGWYKAEVEVTYANLNGKQCYLEYEIDGETSTTRANKPALSAVANERKNEFVGPQQDPGDIKTV